MVTIMRQCAAAVVTEAEKAIGSAISPEDVAIFRQAARRDLTGLKRSTVPMASAETGPLGPLWPDGEPDWYASNVYE
jgi:hypothetical protein